MAPESRLGLTASYQPGPVFAIEHSRNLDQLDAGIAVGA
jgi:hypothetical protein